MLQANEATYKRLSTFDSVEELDEAVRKHKSAHDLAATESAVLDVLARYSCVYKGVSFLSKNNIGKLIGKSRRTVIRACNRLAERGIIRQYDMKRVSGDYRQTSNAVVISKPNADTPDMSHQKAQKPSKPKTYVLDTAGEQANNHPVSLRHSIPTPIYEALAPMFNAEELYEAYAVLLRAKATVDRSVRVEEHVEYVDAFRACVRRFKGGHVRKLYAYLYAAWSKVSRGIYWREAAKELYV